MRNSSFHSMLLLILGASTACAIDFEKGKDGDVVRQLGTFQSITNKSDAKIGLVEPGDGLSSGDLRIVCDNGIEADVDTVVDASGDLSIQLAAGVSSLLGCEVRVVTDGVTKVIDDGAGDIECKHPLFDFTHIEVKGNGSVDLEAVDADLLDILVAGNGSLNIDDVMVDMLLIDLRGNGDITLAGDAINADVEISGGGDLWAQDLIVSDTLDVLLNGNGNAVITVLGTVNAEVHGNATLEVYGGAELGNILEVDGGEVIIH